MLFSVKCGILYFSEYFTNIGKNLRNFEVEDRMKHFGLLIWLTQLGLSVAFPLAGFILVAVWLRERFGLGVWVLAVGIVLGFVGAVDGFRTSLKAMERLSGTGEREKHGGGNGYSDIHHS